MKKYTIPHPRTYHFKKYSDACSFFNSHKAFDFVIKVSGLALGKGVILPPSKNEALDAIKRMMIDKEFGMAGNEIVIQERIFGSEVSLIAFSDGNTVIPLLTVQDHKRIFDNDKGPNTGGIGAYAPVPLMTTSLISQIEKNILQPTLAGMKKEKCVYKGILYAGLMITKRGPMVLEYNARFGDPETQPLMMLLQSDLLPILLACVKGTLRKEQIIFRQGAALCVVLAAKGYPVTYKKGEILCGLETVGDNIVVFHAGTVKQNNRIYSSGGRVLGVTAYGKNLKQARAKAYAAIGAHGIYFEGAHYRKDIGKSGLKDQKT